MKNGGPIPSAATEPRTYQLLIALAAPVRIAVGRFGIFDFAAGYYCYTGSARRNLESRVARHLAADKTLRWHVDYLLAAPRARVVAVRRFVEDECTVNARTAGQVPVPGFGASDCHAGCVSHLKYLGRRRPSARGWPSAASTQSGAAPLTRSSSAANSAGGSGGLNQ